MIGVRLDMKERIYFVTNCSDGQGWAGWTGCIASSLLGKEKARIGIEKRKQKAGE